MKLVAITGFARSAALLVMFIALIRSVVAADFFINWHEASHVFFGRDADSIRAAIVDEDSVLRPLSDKDRDDEGSGKAVLVTPPVVNARCLSEVEDMTVYSMALSHFGGWYDSITTFWCVVICYAIYLLANAVDKDVATNNKRIRVWVWLAELILVPLSLHPALVQPALPSRRYHSPEKAVARCREIAPPQNLDSNVKTLVDIILEKEAKR